MAEVAVSLEDVHSDIGTLEHVEDVSVVLDHFPLGLGLAQATLLLAPHLHRALKVASLLLRGLRLLLTGARSLLRQQALGLKAFLLFAAALFGEARLLMHRKVVEMKAKRRRTEGEKKERGWRMGERGDGGEKRKKKRDETRPKQRAGLNSTQQARARQQ